MKLEDLLFHLENGHGEDVDQLRVIIDGEIEDMDGDKYVFSVDHGIEFLVKNNAVTSLKLFSHHNESQYREYTHSLPLKLKWGMTTEEVHNLIGPPLAIQGEKSVLGIKVQRFERYRYINFDLYLTYLSRNGCLVEVGIQNKSAN